MQAVTITQITPPELETLIESSIKKVLSMQVHEQQENEQLLTIQQAGEVLNLSVPTLYGYVQRAEIPVCKRGKRLYFSRQELLQWVKAGRKKTLTETANEAEAYLKKKGGYHA
jgi:excisionase family DNA binding protein